MCISTVHDARVAFHIHKGSAIALAFGTRQAMETWKPMELPRSLESTIGEIEDTEIGINVRYLKDAEKRQG